MPIGWLCVHVAAGHPHLSRWHQWRLCHLWESWRLSWCFPGDHSISKKTFQMMSFWSLCFQHQPYCTTLAVEHFFETCSLSFNFLFALPKNALLLKLDGLARLVDVHISSPSPRRGRWFHPTQLAIRSLRPENFSLNLPRGRFILVVAMSVVRSVCPFTRNCQYWCYYPHTEIQCL